ncbi:unnamed protein product [Caenorhabditis angaria]|uniref:RRM domain-containing protein n=1 Tax=Caenorhabditis angaria TaxID=860376 RepID=A0A9P1MYE4_9PELO|nr:unnamed protein product [Caenorhabditis angaria]
MGRSRSVSRSPSRERSRSRSASRSPVARRRERSYDRRSRSPRRSSHRDSGRGGSGNMQRDNPPPSKCIGVFNLSTYTTEKDLKEIFGEFGDIERVDLVYDRPSGNSRGFGFIYFYDVEDAAAARDKMSNTDLDGHRIRVDFSFTKRGHSPTPGQYMGDRYERRGNGRDYHGGGGRSRFRSPPRRFDRGGHRDRGGRGGGGDRSGGSRPYDPSSRRRVESYASGGGSSSSHRRRSRS